MCSNVLGEINASDKKNVKDFKIDFNRWTILITNKVSLLTQQLKSRNLDDLSLRTNTYHYCS
ncbi:MAG: hypothetical protein GF317_10100 [Candidatus Lokiarchaeota archaeon]|nr:hypothetical protein [Candidatus Lokiarchaeota archaeon]